jgi:hypothetical protein
MPPLDACTHPCPEWGSEGKKLLSKWGHCIAAARGLALASTLFPEGIRRHMQVLISPLKICIVFARLLTVAQVQRLV